MGSINLITLEKPSPDEEPIRAKLNEALVRELVLTMKGGAAGLLGATSLYAMLVKPWNSTVSSALFLALAALTLSRLVGGIALERGLVQRVPHMRVFCWLATMYALSGACLAAIIWTSRPHLTLTGVLMLLVIMIAINSTAMVTLAASPFLYVTYLAPAMITWSIVAFAQPLPGLEHVFQVALPIYAVAMLLTMRSVHRSLRNNVVLRLQLAASLGELRDAQSKLLEASRQAGRSDVATAVLHNVGNVLNSVNVSATMINDIVLHLRTTGMSKVVGLIDEHRDDLAGFFRDDPRGQKVTEYFTQLQGALERDKAAAVTELQSLMRNIDHIKIIVASQQSHVTPGGAVESFDVHELLDDALKFAASSYDQDAIELVRDFEAIPPVMLDRHKAMQILMNLLTNAHDAVMTRAEDRRITVRVRRSGHADLEIAVEDNGCGVDLQDLERIFELGFTTKSAGHGLGLHYSACAARELHGNLTARSAGVGLGASFVLMLPLDATAAATQPIRRPTAT